MSSSDKSSAVLSDVTQVVTVTGDVPRVNEYLNAGWVILAVAGGQDSDQQPLISHSLGWAKGGEPVDPA